MTLLANIASAPPASAPPAAPKAEGRGSGKDLSPFGQLIQQIAAAVSAKPVKSAVIKATVKATSEGTVAPAVEKPVLPAVELPLRGRVSRTNIDKDSGKAIKPAAQSSDPVIEVPVPTLPAPLLLKPLEAGQNDRQSDEAVAKNAATEAAPEQAPAPRSDVALEVRIRLEQQPLADAHGPETPVAPVAETPGARPSRSANGQTKSQRATPDDSAPDAPPVPETSRVAAVTAINTTAAAHPRSPEPASTPVAHATSPTSTTLAAPVEAIIAQPEMSAHARPSQAPPANPAQASEPMPAPTPAQQPLRSIALEFAPDGAGDVRLRLSERAGEVHISLHSSDASLTGRLHNGVHDLVGSLSNAGYDADAWTPSQGRQHNQRQSETPRKTRRDSTSAGGENFTLQQPIQEIS